MEGDFQGLLTPEPPDSPEQMEFWDSINRGNNEAESSWSEINTNALLNLPFTKSEVATVLANAKNSEAPGPDGVIADTLRNRTSIDVLTSLFNACLESHLMPSI